MIDIKLKDTSPDSSGTEKPKEIWYSGGVLVELAELRAEVDRVKSAVRETCHEAGVDYLGDDVPLLDALSDLLSHVSGQWKEALEKVVAESKKLKADKARLLKTIKNQRDAPKNEERKGVQ